MGMGLLFLLLSCTRSNSSIPVLATGIPLLDELAVSERVHVFDLNVKPTSVIMIDNTHRWLTASDTLPNPRALDVWRGHVVVVDDGLKRVHFFSEDRALLRTLGGSGTGPGEFQQVVWCSGRSAVTLFDPVLLRFSEFGDAMDPVHTRPSKHPPHRSFLRQSFISDSFYISRTTGQDPELAVVNHAEDRVITYLDFPKPIPYGYSPGALNASYISKGAFDDGSFLVGYQHMPFMFRYEADFKRSGMYHFRYEGDTDRFPIDVSVRDRSNEIFTVQYTQAIPLSGDYVGVIKPGTLYLLDLDKPGPPVAVVRFVHSEREAGFFIRDMAFRGSELFLLDSHYDTVYRFDLSDVFVAAGIPLDEAP